MELFPSSSSFFQLLVRIDRGSLFSKHHERISPRHEPPSFCPVFHLASSREHPVFVFIFVFIFVLFLQLLRLTSQPSNDPWIKDAAILYASSLNRNGPTRIGQKWTSASVARLFMGTRSIRSDSIDFSKDETNVCRLLFAESCKSRCIDFCNFCTPFLILKLFTFTFVSLQWDAENLNSRWIILLMNSVVGIIIVEILK